MFSTNPIEGSSLVHKGNYYSLFVSFDFCCDTNPYQDNYRIMVGRGTSPNGPFTDMNGTDLMQGGGTQVLAGDGVKWSGPGGQTAYLDPQNGNVIVFHTIHLPDGAPYLFVNSLTWTNGWPQIQPLKSTPTGCIGREKVATRYTGFPDDADSQRQTRSSSLFAVAHIFPARYDWIRLYPGGRANRRRNNCAVFQRCSESATSAGRSFYSWSPRRGARCRQASDHGRGLRRKRSHRFPGHC